jgi:hypothetical protein
LEFISIGNSLFRDSTFGARPRAKGRLHGKPPNSSHASFNNLIQLGGDCFAGFAKTSSYFANIETIRRRWPGINALLLNHECVALVWPRNDRFHDHILHFSRE